MLPCCLTALPGAFGCLVNQAPRKHEAEAAVAPMAKGRDGLEMGAIITAFLIRGIPTYLISEVGATATDAKAESPGSDVFPGLLRDRPRLSCLESSSGGNVVDAVESGSPSEYANSDAEGS